MCIAVWLVLSGLSISTISDEQDSQCVCCLFVRATREAGYPERCMHSCTATGRQSGSKTERGHASTTDAPGSSPTHAPGLSMLLLQHRSWAVCCDNMLAGARIMDGPRAAWHAKTGARRANAGSSAAGIACTGGPTGRRAGVNTCRLDGAGWPWVGGGWAPGRTRPRPRTCPPARTPARPPARTRTHAANLVRAGPRPRQTSSGMCTCRSRATTRRSKIAVD